MKEGKGITKLGEFWLSKDILFILSPNSSNTLLNYKSFTEKSASWLPGWIWSHILKVSIPTLLCTSFLILVTLFEILGPQWPHMLKRREKKQPPHWSPRRVTGNLDLRYTHEILSAFLVCCKYWETLGTVDHIIEPLPGSLSLPGSLLWFHSQMHMMNTKRRWKWERNKGQEKGQSQEMQRLS